jgi:hypothetical protein
VWEYGIHGYTLELAFPITQANAMLKRVRQLFDAEAKKLKFMASTYRSGINIKFGKPYFDLLGQVTYGTADGADWDKGVIMLDFPSYKPNIGDGLRYNEPFCKLNRRREGNSADGIQITNLRKYLLMSSLAVRIGRRIQERSLSDLRRT